MKNLNIRRNVHFIGIGGVSMSGIATILHNNGYTVTGSDRDDSEITEKLKEIGIPVYKGHNRENISEEVELVIYTAAIKEDNEELKFAREFGKEIMVRAEILGKIVSSYKNSICIAGTHGKTTTTAILAHMLISLGCEPTVSIGANLEAIGGNFIVGNSDFFLTEACEYAGSFLHFNPEIGVILNTDYDHTDYYKTPKELTDAFYSFAKNSKNVVWGVETEIKDLGLLGEHNNHNASCALEVIRLLGLDTEAAIKSLKTYKGPKRRLEIKGMAHDNLLIIDDYAHHPNEIMPTLKAVKEHYSDRDIYVIYQPHTYSRTKSFLKEFSESFTLAKHTYILPIYAAREENTYNIFSEDLVKITPNSTYVEDEDDFLKKIPKNFLKNSLLITMGATNVYKIGDNLLKE